MDSKALKDLYNGLWGDGRDVKVDMELTVNDLSLKFPGVYVKHNTTIKEIFQAGILAMIKQEQEGKPTEEDFKPYGATGTFLNVEKISYRKGEYLVEEHKGNEFIVVNQESGFRLDEKSPRYKGIIKKYKKEFRPDLLE